MRSPGVGSENEIDVDSECSSCIRVAASTNSLHNNSSGLLTFPGLHSEAQSHSRVGLVNGSASGGENGGPGGGGILAPMISGPHQLFYPHQLQLDQLPLQEELDDILDTESDITETENENEIDS